MSLWRKLTIDWPCALGDWLWAILVIAPALFLNRLNRRQTLALAMVLALLLLAPELLQVMAAGDLTMVLASAGDLLLYLEIVAAAIAIAARGHIRQALWIAGQKLRRLCGALPGARPRARDVRRVTRIANTQQRSDDTDGEPGALFPWCPAI